MKLARIFPVVTALAILGAVVFVSGRGDKTSVSTGSNQVTADAPAVTPAPAASPNTGAAPAKAVEVFFLAEETDQALKARTATTGSHRPKANGSLRIGESRAITSKEDGEFIAPRWSPDGLEVLVSRPGYNGLYTVGSEGGGINQVSDKEGIGFSGAWDEDGLISAKRPDGEKQRYNSDGTPVDAVTFENDSSIVGTYTKDDTVFYRAAPGEAAVPVSQGEDRYYGGVVSPDGKYIAYNGVLSGIYIQPVDGSAPPVRIGHGSNPVFMPDSSGIVFSYAEDDGHYLVNGDLYHTNLDGSSISNLTNNSPGIEVNPHISPDGRRIAYEDNGVIRVGQFR